eukprot:m.446632 g.446632  ORF g.446632 m.446632 type:complete len:257 (-) comp21497_c0_seq77:3238-4008(-)
MADQGSPNVERTPEEVTVVSSRSAVNGEPGRSLAVTARDVETNSRVISSSSMDDDSDDGDFSRSCDMQVLLITSLFFVQVHTKHAKLIITLKCMLHVLSSEYMPLHNHPAAMDGDDTDFDGDEVNIDDENDPCNGYSYDFNTIGEQNGIIASTSSEIQDCSADGLDRILGETLRIPVDSKVFPTPDRPPPVQPAPLDAEDIPMTEAKIDEIKSLMAGMKMPSALDKQKEIPAWVDKFDGFQTSVKQQPTTLNRPDK